MDLFGYFMFILVTFVLSIFWLFWVNRFLKSEKGFTDGTESGESQSKINVEKYLAFANQQLGKEDFLIPDYKFQPFELTKIKPDLAPTPEKIERDLKIQYRKSIYVGKSFPLEITIAAEGKSIEISEADRIICTIKTEKLNFEAFEKEPRVSVELKFAEGDFKVNQAKKTQKLRALKNTVYKFIVTPLKGEECVLTVVFSFMDKIPLFKTNEKVIIDKITTEAQKETKEHSEQMKMVPVQDDEKEVVIKSIDLLISVKQLLGFNAKQLDLVKKALPVVLGFIVFANQIATGEPVFTDAIVTAASVLFYAFGIEGTDQVMKAISKTNS